MWDYTLNQLMRLAAGLAGALVLAAAVAALPPPEHGLQASTFASAWLAHLHDFARLRFGTSQLSEAPAAFEVSRRLPLTLSLIGPGAVVALLFGAPLGVILGSGRQWRAASPLVQIVAAAPVFCAGLALLWAAYHVFGWHEGRQAGAVLWTEAGGKPLGYAAWAHALALPVLTVGAAGAAAVQLALRHAAAQMSEAPFRRQLRLLGLSGVDADATYLAAPVAAGLFASLGEIVLALFSAAAIAEWVFGWPGMAALFVKSVALADWNVAALVLLIIAAIKLGADFCGLIAARLIAPGEVAS